MNCPVLVTAVSSSSDRNVALAMPKSMTLGVGFPSRTSNEDIGRLDVAVNHATSVGMVDRFANGSE